VTDQGDKYRPQRRRPSAESRNIAIDDAALPLTLPDGDTEPPGGTADDGEGDTSYSPPSRPSLPLDAWNEDRLRRSSLPPSGSTSLWPAARLTPAPGPATNDPPSGDAFDLVDRSTPTRERIDLTSEMAERFALDDFTGSLRAAELLLGRDPTDAVAQHYAKVSREKLEQLWLARLTQQGTVPVVAVQESEVRWLGLHPKARRFLARVDGVVDCEALIADSGLPRLDALRLLLQLLDTGAIRLVYPQRGS